VGLNQSGEEHSKAGHAPPLGLSNRVDRVWIPSISTVIPGHIQKSYAYKFESFEPHIRGLVMCWPGPCSATQS
jgi:hypothetical protein